MSRPFFSPAAPVEIGSSLVPLRAPEHHGSRALRPGQRIVAGRVFYSAAWLDLAAGQDSSSAITTSLLGGTTGDQAAARTRPGESLQA
jgi:hypothetical protein